MVISRFNTCILVVCIQQLTASLVQKNHLKLLHRCHYLGTAHSQRLSAQTQQKRTKEAMMADYTADAQSKTTEEDQSGKK